MSHERASTSGARVAPLNVTLRARRFSARHHCCRDSRAAPRLRRGETARWEQLGIFFSSSGNGPGLLLLTTCRGTGAWRCGDAASPARTPGESGMAGRSPYSSLPKMNRRERSQTSQVSTGKALLGAVHVEQSAVAEREAGTYVSCTRIRSRGPSGRALCWERLGIGPDGTRGAQGVRP